MSIKLFLAFLFLVYGSGQAWGSVDTLQPVADETVQWSVSGCDGGEHYDCVDDAPGSPDGTDTYVNYPSTGKSEVFRHDSIFVSNIDSVVIRINAEPAAGDAYLLVGWEYFTEEVWTFYVQDSVLLSDTWTDYSVCAPGLEFSEPGTWAYEYLNNRRFGARTTTLFKNAARMTQVFLIVYSAEAERKPSDSIIRENEDAKGICKGRIVR